ncbi:MAG: SusD/RagB family nutrient-binding outer membrane lipoprotein, partial [Balneolaceae bacterium]|nr:SusD/RagB family nutrient-binding outer membrane lipoprotein [Balneolaceae bacterium]
NTTVQGHSSWPGDPPGVDAYSRINDMLTDLEDPMIFQTYAEVEFMLAELAVRNWTTDSAEDHYNAGVRAAMEYLSVYDPGGGADIADADITNYLNNNPFNTGGNPDEQLEQINTQYWAAVFLNGIEAYSNWRRSGYPDLEPAPIDDPNPAPGSDTNGEFIRRLLYPDNEGILNASNYEEVINRQGPNSMTTRVWWDAQ